MICKIKSSKREPKLGGAASQKLLTILYGDLNVLPYLEFVFLHEEKELSHFFFLTLNHTSAYWFWLQIMVLKYHHKPCSRSYVSQEQSKHSFKSSLHRKLDENQHHIFHIKLHFKSAKHPTRVPRIHMKKMTTNDLNIIYRLRETFL